MNFLMHPASQKADTVILFQNALGAGDKLVSASFSMGGPASKVAKIFDITAKFGTPDFEPSVRALITKHRLHAVMPVRQDQFIWWKEFELRHPALKVLLSDLPTLHICNNKKVSYDFLATHGFPVAPYALSSDGTFAQLTQKLGALPWIAKPIDGSGSRGIEWITCEADFNRIPLRAPLLLQAKLTGDEYTLNCYVDRSGKCRTVIPHKRIAVTDGQVSTGVTVNDPTLIALATRLAETLPGAYGPLNFQLFHNPALGPISPTSVSFTDLNPRIGGGYVLAHQAGGHFVNWIIAEAKGQKLPSKITWKPGTRLERIDGKATFTQV